MNGRISIDSAVIILWKRPTGMAEKAQPRPSEHVQARSVASSLLMPALVAFIDGALGWRTQGEQLRAQNQGASDLQNRGGFTPEVFSEPLATEDAEAAAKKVFHAMLNLGIRTPNGRMAWGYVDAYGKTFRVGAPRSV